MTIKALKTADGGKLITAVVKSGAAYGTQLHDCMVQCALHIRDHGDVSLAQRLIIELRENPDEALKAAAVTNVQGIVKWFGDVCPMTFRNQTLKLMDTTSDTYTAWLKRMLEHTENDDHEAGQPDDQTLGGRAFFVEWGNSHPFWTDGAVINAQRTAIRVLGVK